MNSDVPRENLRRPERAPPRDTLPAFWGPTDRSGSRNRTPQERGQIADRNGDSLKLKGLAAFRRKNKLVS